MTKTFKSRLLGVLLSLLVVVTGGFGVSLMNGDNASVAYAETNCTYENGFCTTHTSSDDCYYEACTQNSEGYYEIANGGNMFWFAQKTYNDDCFYYGTTNGKIVVDEIDLENRIWTPIGSNYPFQSIFDGNGATISGLKITATSNSKGLFGYLCVGTVKNLTVKGEIVISATESTAVANVGGVIAQATSNAKVENVTSYVNINDTNQTANTSNANIGGVVGQISKATITNCNYYGTMTMQNGSTCGGVVGDLNGTASYCNNYGNVTFTGVGKHIGGVIGGIGDGAIVTCCANYGNVSSGDPDCIGGVVAYGYTNGKIENCANIGTVTCTGSTGGYVGGILGYINQGSFKGVFNCFNYGKIVSTNGTTNYPGAIIGWNRSGANGSNNYYLDTSCGSASSGNSITATAKTAAAFKSGEVAYLLNNGVTDGTQAWYQTLNIVDIAKNTYPTFSGETVYYTRIGGCCEGSYTYGYRNVDLNDSEISITHGVKNDLRAEEVNGDTYKVCVYCNDCNKLVWEYEVTQKDMVYDGIEHKRNDFWSYTDSGFERAKEFGNYHLVGAILNNPSIFVRYKEPNGEDYNTLRGEDAIIKAVGSYEYEIRMYSLTGKIDENGSWYGGTSPSLDGTFTFKYYAEILPAPVTVTFEDYDGATLGETTLDSDNSEYSAPIYTIPSNDYYTFTFKYWHCEQTGENYTSENLPSYEELFNAGYTNVTFKAVYDIQYKKSFELVGSIDEDTGLSDSGIYTNGENVKIVETDKNGNVTGDVNVYANYKIATNDGVAALLLIPKYDSKFTISAVSVNGQLVYNPRSIGATSNEILSGWTATVTGTQTGWDTFKIVLEQLPVSTATGDMFIQIVYTMSAKNVATGEYSFGFVTKYYSDTADATTNENLSHNDRSEAYGVLYGDEIASLCEVKISVTDAKIIIVKRQDAQAELVNNNVVYDANNVNIFEDCYYKENELEEQIKNELVYHYSAFGTTLVNGDSWDWLQYVHFNWYDKNGNALESAPKNVGVYYVGIYADKNDYFNAFAETQFNFYIIPYTIDVEVAKPNDKTYNADAQTWVNDTFTISYVDGKAAFGSEAGYTYTVTDNTKTTNYYEDGSVVRNWAGTYTVTLTFKATDNYTFKDQTVSGASVDISKDGTTKTITFEVQILKYAATVSAANKTSQYSDDLVSLSMGNLIDADGVLVKDLPNQGNVLKFVYTTTATKESIVGKYPITITAEGSAAGSYDITFIHEMKGADTNGNNGTYTITKKIINIPTIDPLTYNGVGQFPKVTAAATVNGKVAYSFSGDEKINVGNYTLTATLASGNYKWNSETITTLYTTLDWKIIPVVLTVTIGDYTTQYGEDLATILPTIDPENGLQNGETLASIGVTYIIGHGFDTEKDAKGKLPVGTYVITANYDGSNYEITFVNGNYEVTKKILDGEDLAEIIAQIVGATKEYTGSELTWAYNEETKDFTIVGELNGIAYSDIISITSVAAQDDDYTNANGKLDGDSWTYWDPETKLYYTVTLSVKETYQDRYMLYQGENGDAVYTEEGVEVEVFIKQATNVWTETPYVNAADIDSYKHGADAKFKGVGEVSIVIKDSEGNEVDSKNLVKGTNYTVYFTVVETNNYTGLSKEITFALEGYSVVTLPTVYLDEENGTIVVPNGNVMITYDGLTHKFVVVPDGEGKYTITINTGDYSTWKNANGAYYITIAVTENYQWGDDDRADKTYTLNIGKAALTVKATTYNVSFGDTIDKYETTASGFVNGEAYATYGSIDVNSYLTCSYVAGDQVWGKVGTHEITFVGTCQSDLDALLTNYNVTLVDGAVNVAVMQLELDLSELQGKLDSEAWELWTNLVATNGGYTLEYNATNHTFYLKESSYPTQLVPTITYKYNSGEFGADLPCNAGTYQIKVVFNIKDGLDKDNYYWKNPEDTVSLTITKVGITVKTNGQTVIYTGNNVALNTTDASEAILSLTDGRDITDTTFDFIRTGIVINYVKLNGDYSAVGTYTNAITAELTYAETNYTITFVDGTLIIEKGNLSWEITLKTENRDYNGSAIKEGIDGSDETKAKDYYAWLNESADRQYLTYKFYTKDGETYTAISAPANAGTYYVKAFYDDTIANAIDTDYVEIVIGKATIVISGVENIEKNYLQDYEVNPTATKPVLETEDGYTPIVKVEYYNGTLLLESKPLTVGTYTIKLTIENANDNYQAEVVEKTLIIKKATLNGVEFKYDKDTATWVAITQTTDNEDINKYGNVTVTYMVGGDAVSGLSYTAKSTGIFTLVASIEGNENFANSESTMVEVFSVEFADKVANHAKTETVYDFSKVAPTQYRFSGQIATQADCCNDGAAKITIDGYTFAKQWKLGEDDYGFTAQVNESIVLYAVWDINKYTVKWMNDDNKIYEATYEYLDTPTYDKDTYGTPTRDTTDEWIYTFGGWSLTIDGEKITIPAITENVTYYAFYTKEGVTYKIIFMVSEDGGAYREYKTIEAANFGDTLTGLYSLANVTWFRGDVWYADEARTQLITTMPVAKDGITVYGAYVFDIGNGDVNADGQITTDDITIYREWVVGGYEMTIVEKGTEWTLVRNDGFDASGKYFLKRVADVNADTSDDIRDITTIRMAIVEGYGYKTLTGIDFAKVTGQAVCVHKHVSDGVYEMDETSHWLICEACVDKYNVEEHIDEDGDGYCDVCGDCLLFTTELSQDGTYYWLEDYNGDTSVTELTIPSTVHGKKVLNFAQRLLEDCTSLETLTCWIPDQGFSSFFSAAYGSWNYVPTTLKHVIISEGVTNIPARAFQYLENIESVEIPDSVTSIDNEAFYSCKALSNLELPENLTEIGESAFAYSGLTSLSVPSGVEYINTHLFQYCSELQSVELPNSITGFGTAVFSNCEKLVSISIPEGVTSISDQLFYYCCALEDVTIPDSVVSVGVQAFQNCGKLKSIKLPRNLKSIAESAFGGYDLETVYYSGTETEWAKIEIVEDGNDYLLNDTMHYYYSETQPTDTENKYWHYENGEPTIWTVE